MEVLWGVVGTSNQKEAACEAMDGPLIFAGIDLLADHYGAVCASPRHARWVEGLPPGTAASWYDRTVHHCHTQCKTFVDHGHKV